MYLRLYFQRPSSVISTGLWLHRCSAELNTGFWRIAQPGARLPFLTIVFRVISPNPNLNSCFLLDITANTIHIILGNSITKFPYFYNSDPLPHQPNRHMLLGVVLMVTHRETASCFTKICKVSRKNIAHFFISRIDNI